jgi:hypothetical protein
MPVRGSGLFLNFVGISAAILIPSFDLDSLLSLPEPFYAFSIGMSRQEYAAGVIF